MNTDFVLRVLECMKEDQSWLWWRLDGDYAPVTFFIECNDFFYWGSADCERITEQNIHILEQAMKDADDPQLFVCRVRGMRPQGACYKNIEDDKKHWFDGCGPEREIDFLNPYDQNNNYMYKKEK